MGVVVVGEAKEMIYMSAKDAAQNIS